MCRRIFLILLIASPLFGQTYSMSNGDTLTATLYIRGDNVFGALIKVRYDTSYFDMIEATERLSDFELTAIRADSTDGDGKRVVIAAYFTDDNISRLRRDLLRMKLAAKQTGSTSIVFYSSEAYSGYDSTSTYLNKRSDVSMVNGTYTITIN